MPGYLVLARKYRSETFDEVVGQEPIARTLRNAITAGRVAHAYLFSGTRGVGKTTMARIFAKALNCLSSDEPTGDPCCKCNACISIARGDDVDVIEIDGASNRGIEEIRELRANAIFNPARSRFKVYYIDEVHMLTREAFNALLKTLEEPPGHVKFIFSTTEPEKVPATILSRCQRFDFRNIPTRAICEHLEELCRRENVEVDADATYRIARAGAGSMRDALSLLDQLLAACAGKVTDAEVVRVLGTPSDELTAGIARAIADGDSAGAINRIDEILSSGVTLASVAKALGGAFRNMMLAKTCGADSELIELPDTQRKEIGELAGRFSTPALVHAVGVLQRAEANIRGSSLARGIFEAAMVRLAEAEKFIDPASILERLESLCGAQPAGNLKKKPPAQARSLTARDRSDSTGGEEANIEWNIQWLKTNWMDVIEQLTRRKYMQVAGAIRLAIPVDFRDGELTLGFDDVHETLRQRCTDRLAEAANKAIGDLAGRDVRCEFISVGLTPNGKTFVPPKSQTLSTAQRDEIRKDPAVQGVLDLFGGEVVDIRRDRQPPEPLADETDESDDE